MKKIFYQILLGLTLFLWVIFHSLEAFFKEISSWLDEKMNNLAKKILEENESK